MNTQVFAMDEMNKRLQAAPQQSTGEKKKPAHIDIDAMMRQKPTAHEPTPEEIAAINGQAAPIRTAAPAPAEKMPTLQELIKAAQPEKCELDELHAGRMLAKILKPRFCYNSTAKRWSLYEAGLWSIDLRCTVQRYVKTVIEEILAYIAKHQSENETAKQAAIKFWSRYLQKRNRDIMLDDAQKEITIPREDFDTDTNLLHFTNGTLELDTMTFREHRAADMLTKSTRTVYDRSATLPRWNKFISEILPDADTRKHLQKCFGYALTGNPCEERFFILYGNSTRNGKSTLLDSIATVFGDFAIAVNPATFASVTHENSSAPNEDVARIAGTRLAVTSEPQQGMILNTAGIKRFTGKNKISARFLQQNSFDFTPSCSIFFDTNYKMRVLDNTVFASDRVDLITFPRHFSREERDTSLKQKFTTEQAKSAIMNWILDGLFLYRKEGLIPPKQVQADTDQYAQESDKIAQFAADCIEAAGEKDWFTLPAAYDHFKTWTKENGFGTENKTNFYSLMRARYGKEEQIWDSATSRNIRGIKGYRLT